jgi:hypothetical protein
VARGSSRRGSVESRARTERLAGRLRAILVLAHSHPKENDEMKALGTLATVIGTWELPGHFEPGLPTGAPNQLFGVLDPGDSVDITSVYDGGITALLGSADRFSAPGKNVSDEGTIPWPAGVRGSGGAQEMSLAEVEVYGACGGSSPLF